MSGTTHYFVSLQLLLEQSLLILLLLSLSNIPIINKDGLLLTKKNSLASPEVPVVEIEMTLLVV